MFFQMYWMYFASGLVIYITMRLTLRYFFNNHYNNSRMDGDNGDHDEKVLPNRVAEVKKQQDTTDPPPSDEDNDEWTPSLENVTHTPLKFAPLPTNESLARSAAFYQLMNRRRTVRHFDTRPVPKEIIYNAIRTAGTSPSGAHTEPWTFVLVASADTKAQIREIIELEEEINYRKRMGKTWTTDLKPFRTNWIKPYLTDAPYLILVFKQTYSQRFDGKKRLHYYNEESVCIAAGLLIAAIHDAGLCSLTSTPLNCGPALRTLLNRPMNEKLVLLLPVGYPSPDCTVPDLQRKDLDEILVEV